MSAVIAVEQPVYAGPLGLVKTLDLSIECPAFQGSLVTLVKCTLQRKLDLREVPLHPLCSAYLEYLQQQRESEEEEAIVSSLLALSYLIERKAKSLLPGEETLVEEDEALELADAIPELERFQMALGHLVEAEHERHQLYFRVQGDDPALQDLPVTLPDLSLDVLGSALERILNRADEQPEIRLGKPRRSLAEQMRLVLSLLTGEPQYLQSLIGDHFSRNEAVWWFLALLELARVRQAELLVDDLGELLCRRPQWN